MGSTGIPDCWLPCPPTCRSVISNLFFSFKTPLDGKYDTKVPVESRFHPGTVFVKASGMSCQIGLLVDLTKTDRYYADKTPIEKKGCQYLKIQCEGHDMPPSDDDVKEFTAKCKSFLDKNPHGHIGVHCTHGFNRTGYMIASYLVSELKYSVDKAISEFAKSRPPGIYKSEYILKLFEKYGDGSASLPPTPPLPDWHTQLKQITANEIVERVHREVESFTDSDKDRFPGCQPVSMDRNNIKLLENDYLVSEKADGTRYLMYIDGEKETYFIDRNNNVYFMDGLSFPSAQGPSIHTFKTLVDGEMVTANVAGKYEQHYLLYDLMSLNGVKVGRREFKSRYKDIKDNIIIPREKAMKLKSIIESKEPIRIKRKQFLSVNTPNISELLSKEYKTRSPHQLDGLIFQPVKNPYKPGTCKEILKWKPPSHNSVDFLLKITKEQRYGMSPRKVGELFVGGQNHAFGKMLDTKDMDHLNGKIIECTLDVKTGRWVLLRQRTDKKTPNYISTAIAVLRSIRYPVDEQYLKNFVAELEKRTSKDAGCDPRTSGQAPNNGNDGKQKVQQETDMNPKRGASVETGRHPTKYKPKQLHSSSDPKEGSSKNVHSSVKPPSQKYKSDLHKADYTNVAGISPKAVPDTPKADYANVSGLKKLMEPPKPAPESPKTDCSNVEGNETLMQIPKAVVVASVTVTPQANCTFVKEIKKLSETPKVVPQSPDLNVVGVGRLLRTPASTPKADYSNVEDVKRLLQTPKALSLPEQEEDKLEVKEPQILSEEEKENDRPISLDCQTPPEKELSPSDDISAPASKVAELTEGAASPGTTKRRGRETAEKIQAIPEEQVIVPVALDTKKNKEEAVPLSSKVKDDVAEGQDQPEKTEEVVQTPSSSVKEDVNEEPPSPVEPTTPSPVKTVTTKAPEEEQGGKMEKEEVAAITPAPRSTKKTPAKASVETAATEAPEEESEEKVEDVATPARLSAKKYSAKKATPAPTKMNEIEREAMIQAILKMNQISNRRSKKTATPAPVQSINGNAEAEEEASTPARRGPKKGATPARDKKASLAARNKVEEEVAEESEESSANEDTLAEPETTEEDDAKEATKETVREEEAKPASPPTRRRQKKVVEPVSEPVARKPSTRHGRQAATSVPELKVVEKKEESVSEKEESLAPVVVRGGRKAPAKKKPEQSASPDTPVKTTRINKRAAPASKKEKLAQEPEKQASPAPAEMTRNTTKKTITEEVEEPKPAPASRRGRSTKAAQKVEEEEKEEEVEEVEIKKPVGRGGRKAPAKAAAAPVVEEEASEEEEEEIVAAKSKRTASKLVEEKKKHRRVTKKHGSLDDVEMMHEGKGHAADIHHHVTDSSLEEGEESLVKARRGSKKIVHYDVPAAAVKTGVRSGKKSESARLPPESSTETVTSKKVQASPPTDQPAAKRSRVTKVNASEQERETTPPCRTSQSKRN